MCTRGLQFSLAIAILVGLGGSTSVAGSGVPTPADPDLFAIEVYATVTDPFHIAFDRAGNLYVGRSDNSQPYRIRKILPGGATVIEFGAAVWDPDGVIVDTGGTFGVPGAVLVAGADRDSPTAPFDARIFRISPSGASTTVLAAAPAGSDELNNPQQMAFAPDGALLIANFGASAANDFGTVSTVDPFTTAPSVVQDVGAALGGIATSPAGRVFVSASLSGEIREIVGSGPGGDVLVTGGLSFPDALAHIPFLTPRVSMPLIAVERAAGRLTLVNPDTGATEMFATGFDGPFGMAIGPDLCLYVAEFGSDRIWRIGLRGEGGIVLCPTAGPSSRSRPLED